MCIRDRDESDPDQDGVEHGGADFRGVSAAAVRDGTGECGEAAGDAAESQPGEMTLRASDTSPLRLLVNGAMGRMGQAIIACAKLDPGVEVVAQVDEGDDFAKALPEAEAVIEFSHHTVTAAVARACAAAGKELVIGTTGHNEGEIEQIRAAGESIPVVFAPNFSVGAVSYTHLDVYKRQ